jgi:hypothetical protein
MNIAFNRGLSRTCFAAKSTKKRRLPADHGLTRIRNGEQEETEETEKKDRKVEIGIAARRRKRHNARAES